MLASVCATVDVCSTGPPATQKISSVPANSDGQRHLTVKSRSRFNDTVFPTTVVFPNIANFKRQRRFHQAQNSSHFYSTVDTLTKMQSHAVLMQDVRSQFNELLMLRKILASRREKAEREQAQQIPPPPPPPPPAPSHARAAIPMETLKHEMVKRMARYHGSSQRSRSGGLATQPSPSVTEPAASPPPTASVLRSPVVPVAFRRQHTLSSVLSRVNRLQPSKAAAAPLPVLFGGYSEDTACGHSWHAPRYDYAFDSKACEGIEPAPRVADAGAQSHDRVRWVHPAAWEDEPPGFAAHEELLLFADDDDGENPAA